METCLLLAFGLLPDGAKDSSVQSSKTEHHSVLKVGNPDLGQWDCFGQEICIVKEGTLRNSINAHLSSHKLPFKLNVIDKNCNHNNVSMNHQIRIKLVYVFDWVLQRHRV